MITNENQINKQYNLQSRYNYYQFIRINLTTVKKDF